MIGKRHLDNSDNQPYKRSDKNCLSYTPFDSYYPIDRLTDKERIHKQFGNYSPDIRLDNLSHRLSDSYQQPDKLADKFRSCTRSDKLFDKLDCK